FNLPALTFTQGTGTDAGDITGIKTARHITQIRAGNGGDIVNGASGDGGDVSNITINGLLNDGIFGGNGGAVTTAGVAGVGGSVSMVTATLLRADMDPV